MSGSAWVNKKKKVTHFDVAKDIPNVKNVFKIEEHGTVTLIYDRYLDIKEDGEFFFTEYQGFKYWFKVDLKNNRFYARKKWIGYNGKEWDNEIDISLSMILALKSNLDAYPDSKETAIIEKKTGKRFSLRITPTFFVIEVLNKKNRIDSLFSIHRFVFIRFLYQIVYDPNKEEWYVNQETGEVYFKKKRKREEL